MADSAAGKTKYFTAIDGLRLLASVNVVLFHFEGIGGFHDMGGSPAWFFRLVKGPAFHASLFFILGGFIFTTKFAPKIAEFNSWAFLKKRFSELYPLHLITTLTMAALYVIKRSATGDVDIPKLLYSLFMHLSFLWSVCPVGSLNLNTPSWALSAMFLCYVLFGPLLRWSLRLKTRAEVMVYMLLFMFPLILCGYVFSALGSPQDYYQLFHGFAPVRFFEFGLGVLLARFLMMRDESKSAARPSYLMALRCDVAIVAVICLIFFNLSSIVRCSPEMKWFSYHVFMIPLYLLIIYAVSFEKGIIARVLSLKIIQRMGRTSFYPYLVHIPLMSVITLICEHIWDYKKFLHVPLNIAVFMVVLYVCSYLYVYAIRNKRRARKAASVLKNKT
jgi:peptidoglycan/LPS O-acetylase OafA/YrhL